MGLHKEARATYQQVLSMEGMPNGKLINVYNRISNSLSVTGDFSKALEMHKKAYELIESELTTDCEKNVYYNNLAVIYHRMEDIDGAIENLNKSAIYQKKCSKEYRLIANFINFTSVYIQKKEYDIAKAYLDSVLVVIEKLRYDPIQFYIKILQATIYTEEGLFEEAEQIYGEIATVLTKTESYEKIGGYYLNYGKFNMATQQYSKAFEACKKGYDIYSKGNFVYKKKLCAKCLYEVSAKRADAKEELKWYKEYHTINDALITVEAKDKINQLEFNNKYKEEKLVYEKNILALEYKIKQEEKNKFIILVVLLAILPLAFSLWWVYRSEKKKRLLLEENLKNKSLIAVQAEKLKEQEKQKLSFFANIAHEFQTPLTIISGQSARLLEEEQIAQKDKLAISTISRNSTNLLHLTKQILEGTKSDDWKMKLKVEQFYLYEVLNPIITEFKVLATEKKLQLNMDCQKTQELVLQTDANKLCVIIENILSNAIRHSKSEGTITINCQAINDQLRIDFKDNGIGIPPDKLPYIFDKFYQVSSADNIKEHAGGFGMGLSMCKEYADLLGGNIKVQSTLNVCSTFRLEIPTHLKRAIAITKQVPKYKRASIISVTSIPDTIFVCESLATILIVEDNKDIWLYLQHLLEGQYNLAFASNGLEALSYLENEPIPNLIITDLMMPYMDGLSLIENLKSNSAFNFIPIVVLTARNDVGEKIIGLSLNRDDYIIKPFDNVIFVARIEYLLSLSKNSFESITALKKEQVKLTPRDQAWLEQIEALVRNSLGDLDFTSATIASEINVSIVHLNRKLKSLIGFTSSKYILEARMRKALELLEKGEINTVKEVCYNVGFKEPKYFARNFKERFGKNPSEFLKERSH